MSRFYASGESGGRVCGDFVSGGCVLNAHGLKFDRMWLFIERLSSVFRWMRAQTASGTDFASFSCVSFSKNATVDEKVMSNSQVAGNQQGIPPYFQRDAEQKSKRKEMKMEHRCEGAKVCGLCQFWDGERELVRGSRPLRVKCETGSHPCKLRHFSCLSSSTTAGSCKQFKKWCELP